MPSTLLWSWVLAGILVGYLAIVAPLIGRRAAARQESERPSPSRVLPLSIAEQWSMAAVALLVVGLSPSLDLAGVGIRQPDDPALTYGIAFALPIAMVPLVLFMRWLVRNGGKVPGSDAYSSLLPRTAGERWLAGGAAVSAGICEELVYRGLFIALGTSLGLSPPAAAAVAVAVFMLGHLYQGWSGALLSLLAGVAFTGLYLRTGSLIAPIVVHVLVDLRSLLFTPQPQAQSQPARAES
ncbi:CPBP family intramembrane glutamic endopeptidase [Nonomuraea sp. NPDC050404]|uniref:CPBP family intramembrane glutamic endopeptidase n=1 Tax=Nonomuraea sp. NPDC050404 TaxID=3155783 RepID=UPI0033C80960